jgi:hypothetical protein
MLKFIEGLAPGVLAIEAVDRVTHEGYRVVLVPKAEAMFGGGPIKMLYVIVRDVTGFEVAALADDSAPGLKHGHDFSHIAAVRDHAWLNAAIYRFRPFFLGQVRLCTLTELAAAKNWIASTV